MNRAALLVAFLVSNVSTCPAFAQTPAPVIRSRADVVEVNVVARDKAGIVVTDLRPDDFEVLDEGRPQPIAVFSPDADRTVTGDSLPSGTFTNRLPPGADRGRHVVILLDWLNTGWLD